MKVDQKTQAALAYIKRADGKILCVWNRRYQGWGLPGGKVEPGEFLTQALAREMLEEIGVTPQHMTPLYDAPTVSSDSGRHVHVFAVEPGQSFVPRAMEKDCPIEWRTPEDLLINSPFASFYEKMFKAIVGRDLFYEHVIPRETCGAIIYPNGRYEPHVICDKPRGHWRSMQVTVGDVPVRAEVERLVDDVGLWSQRAEFAEADLMDLRARAMRLEEAARDMLALEARRMYERDDDLDEPTPCPCSGCEGLRAALSVEPASPVKKEIV